MVTVVLSIIDGLIKLAVVAAEKADKEQFNRFLDRHNDNMDVILGVLKKLKVGDD